MGKLFKATTAFAIAFYVWSPASFAAYIDTPAVSRLRAEIKAERPHDKLAAQWAQAKIQLQASLTR